MPGVAMVIYWEVCSGGLQFLAANNKITSGGANMPMWVLWDGSCSLLTWVPCLLGFARGCEGLCV